MTTITNYDTWLEYHFDTELEMNQAINDYNTEHNTVFRLDHTSLANPKPGKYWIRVFAKKEIEWICKEFDTEEEAVAALNTYEAPDGFVLWNFDGIAIHKDVILRKWCFKHFRLVDTKQNIGETK